MIRVARWCVVVLLCVPAIARAGNPLAERVPASAVVYAGWAGADSLGELWRSSQAASVLGGLDPRALAGDAWGKLSAGWDDNARAAATTAAEILFRRPSAVYLFDPRTDDVGLPLYDLGIVCDAGPDAESLAGAVKKLLPASGNLQLYVDGSIVTIATKHFDGPTMAVDAAKPAVAVFVDCRRLVDWVDESAGKDPKAKEFWPKMRAALGLDNVRSYSLTAGFESGQWAWSSTLVAPGPRTGLLSAIEPRPIDPVLAAKVPATATGVSVYNLDLAAIYDSLDQATSAVPDLGDDFHKYTMFASLFIGEPVRKKILASVGPQWVAYTDSASGGTVVLNHTPVPASADGTLQNAARGLVGLFNSQVSGPTIPPRKFDKQVVDGVSVYSARETAGPNPSFAVKDEVVVAALSPDGVVFGLNATGGDGDWTRAAAKRAAGHEGSFDYADVGRTGPRAAEVWAKATGLAIPIDRAAKLSPVVSVSWADQNGTYTRATGPFPLAGLLLGDSISPQLVDGGRAAIDEGMTWYSRRRRLVQSQEHQRRIVGAMLTWAAGHGGRFPPDLGTLLVDGVLHGDDLRLFLLPGSAAVVPAEVTAGPPRRQGEWVNESTEYVCTLAGQNLAGLTSWMPVLYERGGTESDDPTPVGFADGHAAVVPAARLRDLLDATRKRLGP